MNENEKDNRAMSDPKPLENFGTESSKAQRSVESEANRDPEGNRTPALAGLAIAVVLLLVGLWLARELTAASKMQDCLMSGRTNCNVIRPQ
jgi:hypothetical protein